MIVAFRRHSLLPFDDCLYALQPSIPHLTRSAMHRCLQRHGISRLPDVEGDKPKRQKFKRYPIGFFHIDIAEVQTAKGKLYLFVTITYQNRFIPDVLRHPVRRAAPEPENSIFTADALRQDPRGEWDQTSPHEAEPPLDQWSGRANEPHDQRCDRQTLPLRKP